jgi:hypothetical protein
MPATFSCRALYMGLNAQSSDGILNDLIEEGLYLDWAEQPATISINCSNAFNKRVNWLFHHARIDLLSLQQIR